MARTHKPGVGGSNPPLATKFMEIQSKKSSWWSTFKNSYLKSHNLKKFYKNFDNKKLDEELNQTIEVFIDSASYSWTSKYWRKMMIDHLKLITEFDLRNSEDILARNYFTFTYFNNSLIEEACKNVQKNTFNLNLNLFKKHKNFSYEESLNHNILTFLIYENIKEKKIFNYFEKLKKRKLNSHGNKQTININNNEVSQDDLNSLLEYEKIEEIIKNVKERKNNYLEIGSGSGRTSQTIMAIQNSIKYVIADIPPAINVSYNNIRRFFPEKKISYAFNIQSNQKLQNIIDRNDVIYIFPHQLDSFPKKFFDISIAIDCLHEMEEKIVKRYMSYFEEKSNSLYFKVWENAALPNSFYKYYSVHNKKDYFIKDTWKEILKEKCIFPSNYYQIGYIF